MKGGFESFSRYLMEGVTPQWHPCMDAVNTELKNLWRESAPGIPSKSDVDTAIQKLLKLEGLVPHVSSSSATASATAAASASSSSYTALGTGICHTPLEAGCPDDVMSDSKPKHAESDLRSPDAFEENMDDVLLGTLEALLPPHPSVVGRKAVHSLSVILRDQFLVMHSSDNVPCHGRKGDNFISRKERRLGGLHEYQILES